MRKIILLTTLVCLIKISFLYSEIYLGGRSSEISSVGWIAKKEKILEKEVFAEHGECFSIARQDKTESVFYGGGYNNVGYVWEKNYKTGKVTSYQLPESRVIYALLNTSKDTLYAAGTHQYKGGFVWKKENGKDWQKVEQPSRATVITSLYEFQGKIFAGGFAKTDGKVWIFSEEKWNRGLALNGAIEINTLTSTKDTLYAAGLKGSSVGGVWKFNGSAWQEDSNLKFSHKIYSSTTDKDNVVYLVGAGDEGKVIWENSKGFWNAMALDDALALYTIKTDKKGNIYAAGWNSKRRGKLWFKKKGKDWSKGKDIEDCFVIRGIA